MLMAKLRLTLRDKIQIVTCDNLYFIMSTVCIFPRPYNPRCFYLILSNQ